MAPIPPLNDPVDTELKFVSPPCYQDHVLMGRPVMAAVEAMELLARQGLARFPFSEAPIICDARFERFLPLPADAPGLSVRCRMKPGSGGKLSAELLSHRKARRSSMSRIKTHVTMAMVPFVGPFDLRPLDVAAVVEGVSVAVTPKVVYRDLIPLGESYRNLRSAVTMSTDGAMATVGSPQNVDIGSPRTLGSPFPLDAAFHAACVWGQCFAGLVTYPAALERRVVHTPACQASEYVARVYPVAAAARELVFDIDLYDLHGNICESVTGLCMREPAVGRTRPPRWLQRLAEDCRHPRLLPQTRIDLSLIDLQAMAPFADSTLSPAEQDRRRAMCRRRARSFTAARLALKRLYRRLNLAAAPFAPPQKLSTIRRDSPRPILPPGQSSGQLHCSVSHDDRFCIAVASAAKVGVDVERISPRPLRVAPLFLSAAERNVIAHADIDPVAAALRAWTAKEAAAKASGMLLADAWHRVRLVVPGTHRSRMEIDGVRVITAFHDFLKGHLFTVLSL